MLQPTGHREWLDLDRWRSSKALTRPGYHEESRQTLPVNNNGKQTGFVAFLFELSHKGATVATFTIRYPTFCLILNRAENLWLTSPWFSAQQVRGTLTWFRSKCLEMGNLWEPGANQRHPFSTVASSIGNQKPKSLSGSFLRKVPSWWGVTKAN